MITTFQKEKLTHLFTILNKSKTGVLKLDDLIIIGDSVLDTLKLDQQEDADKYREIIKRRSISLFKKLTADIVVEKNGSVTLHEWLDFFDNEVIHSSESFILDEIVNLLLSFLFGFFDRNRDGYMAVREYITMFLVLEIPKSELTSAFVRLDTNSDGRLSRYDRRNRDLPHLQQC